MTSVSYREVVGFDPTMAVITTLFGPADNVKSFVYHATVEPVKVTPHVGQVAPFEYVRGYAQVVESVAGRT